MVDGLDRILPAIWPVLIFLCMGWMLATAADECRLAALRAGMPTGVPAPALSRSSLDSGAACASAVPGLGWEGWDAGSRNVRAGRRTGGQARGESSRGDPFSGRDPSSNQGLASEVAVVTGKVEFRIPSGPPRPAGRFRRPSLFSSRP